MDEPALGAPAADEGELPRLGAVRGRAVVRLGIGTPRRLAVEEAAPRQERLVRQVVAARLDLRARPCWRPARGTRVIASVVRKHDDRRAVGQLHEHHELPGLGAVEHVGERDAELRRARVADGRAEVRRVRLGPSADALRDRHARHGRAHR